MSEKKTQFKHFLLDLKISDILNEQITIQLNILYIEFYNVKKYIFQ